MLFRIHTRDWSWILILNFKFLTMKEVKLTEDRKLARFMLGTFIFFSLLTALVVLFSFQYGRQYEREHPRPCINILKESSWLGK